MDLVVGLYKRRQVVMRRGSNTNLHDELYGRLNMVEITMKVTLLL